MGVGAERQLIIYKLLVSMSDVCLSCALRDVQTGRTTFVVLNAEDAAERDVDCDGAPSVVKFDLPSLWRLETAYTQLPHPGFCCCGGRFIGLPASVQAATISSLATTRVSANGEVSRDRAESIRKDSRSQSEGSRSGEPTVEAEALGDLTLTLTRDIGMTLPKYPNSQASLTLDPGCS